MHASGDNRNASGDNRNASKDTQAVTTNMHASNSINDLCSCCWAGLDIFPLALPQELWPSFKILCLPLDALHGS